MCSSNNPGNYSGALFVKHDAFRQFEKKVSKKFDPLRELVVLLQRAHAGEQAAANAYHGHARSVRSSIEKAEIKNIEKEELEHRRQLGVFLASLGSAPDKAREFRMNLIGKIISMLCMIGGWFIPMYGAGKLERENIVEYEIAARWAKLAGRQDLVAFFLNFAEIEWDHELYFRQKVKSHWLSKFFCWSEPQSREHIRDSFNQWSAQFFPFA